MGSEIKEILVGCIIFIGIFGGLMTWVINTNNREEEKKNKKKKAREDFLNEFLKEFQSLNSKNSNFSDYLIDIFDSKAIELFFIILANLK